MCVCVCAVPWNEVDFLIEIREVLFIAIIIIIVNNFNSMEYSSL